jgi:hypothetical protein
MNIYICYHFTQGLHNDALIIKQSLKNYTVYLESYNEIDIYQNNPNNIVKDHIVIFLEHINPNYIVSKRIIFFPNYEYLTKSDIKYMNSNVDLVCCKTYCTKYYLEYVIKVNKEKIVYTGFSSRNKYKKIDETKYGFLHVKGVSNKKNTEILINTWLQHPEWPVLHIIQQFDYSIESDIVMNNITITQRKLDEDELMKIMNTYTFHICPSLCEGFGHYISEGLSCGAVVITNNCAPMNELVNTNTGVLINCIVHKTDVKVLECKITNAIIEKTINKILLLENNVLSEIKKNAKSSFHINLKTFTNKINIVMSFIYNDVILNF